jgi:hypothetical protein
MNCDDFSQGQTYTSIRVKRLLEGDVRLINREIRMKATAGRAVMVGNAFVTTRQMLDCDYNLILLSRDPRWQPAVSGA